MPKGLSLKKVQQKGPPKNQKPITQFFKNANIVAPEILPSSPVKSHGHEEKPVEKNSLKRKVRSPVNSETIEILDEPCANDVPTKTVSKLKNGERTPKKLKFNYGSSTHQNQDKSVINVERSPCKENGHIKVSPHKNTSIKESNTPIKRIKPNNLSNNNHELNSQTNTKRSPLSSVVPVDNFNAGNRSPNYKSCSSATNNHGERKLTPKKQLKFDNEDVGFNLQVPNRRTPRKSPKKEEVLNFPSSVKVTPEKLQDIPSPSKSGSTVKSLNHGHHDIEDDFGDDWGMGDVEEMCGEELDLSRLQRCKVVSVWRHPTRLEMRLMSASGREQATCFVEGVWMDTPLSPGEIISIVADRDRSDSYCISNTAGLLSVRPDHLISCTSVVGGVFCQRKALLQERWRGIDSANTAMTIGILVHELVQKALTQNLVDISQLNAETDKLLKESIQMLYDAGLSMEEARSNVQQYIAPLAEFMRVYVEGKPPTVKPQKDQWAGRIEKVLDIEENVCCPQLGLKGKIDATLEVTIHQRKGRPLTPVPLELKSGRPSVSAEHRGQLVLYGMMLSAIASQHPGTREQTGLLLYLKDRVELRGVSCGYPERRDLLMLRNQLVRFLAPGPEPLDHEQLTDIEDASCLVQQRLPEPIHHRTACAKCPYLTLCSLHLWHTDGPSVCESHPLSALQAQALGHLSPEHIKYFLHWTAMLRIEERCQMMASPLHALWTDSAEKRSKRGTCASNLVLKSVERSGERYLHVFTRSTQVKENVAKAGKPSAGPQEGDFSTVSVDTRPWIAAGVVTVANDTHISILLERDLSSRASASAVFHIDTYDSYATTVQNLTNLGMLLEDSERAARLRAIIIEKQPPEFEAKLPRAVGRLGARLMRSLNIQQQRAVLRALAARQYCLLQGLPGTGKTQTLSVLIQMLAGLRQRVLVTAHTHSAVDNLLARLPSSIRIMRLGSSARVAPSLIDKCEQRLTANCETPEQLAKLYDSMEVVGVTCLGAAHAMLARSTFDVCIMDEATQVVQSTALRPLLFARRFLLAGDPDQLPPVVRSRAARRLGMEESLFHRLTSEGATSTLQLQYRMNQPLAEVANRVAYNFRLKCANEQVANAALKVDLTKISDLSGWLLQCCDPAPENAAIFLDTTAYEGADAKESKSCSNVEEACVILALVDVLIKGGVSPSSIGVIAPYREQVSLLRRCARAGVECSTVDQFQGRDRPVILYACTKRRGKETEVKEGEILNDQRRLAVSVTRAKHKLVVVGDSRALQRYTPLRMLIEACHTIALDCQDLATVVDKYKAEVV